jgi:hypothetical protein
MQSLAEVVRDALRDFQIVGALADAAYVKDCITVQITSKPHQQPRTLPMGQVAVYAFFHHGHALKVGKAGPNTNARYTSQHYYPNSAPSTLARSILNNAARFGVSNLSEASVGAWIRENTDRVNLLLPTTVGNPMLSLLEAFLHVRWKPVFEGRS